ncbi:MAG: DUF3048 C-terminal domain-containing protein, partial [Clostridia bacterium]|nr:DUF3048 C-terminal domain-containing protein [Clostridia bacterium]
AYLQGLGAGSTNSVSVSGADFVKAIDKKGYSTALSNAYDYGHVFQFSNTTVLFSNIARNIKFNVSASRQVDFIYNGNDALYYRYQFDDAEGNLAHVDSANNNQQLAFTNVILMYTDVSEISEDAKSSGNEAALDRKYVNVVGSGTGVYMTCGTMTEITWRKTNENAPLKFYLPGGEEVTFNPGKTFIEILPSTYSTGLEVK